MQLPAAARRATSTTRILLIEGDALRSAASFGCLPRLPADALPIVRGSVLGAQCSIASRSASPTASPQRRFPDSYRYSQRFGDRSVLAVPLLRENRAVGAILLRRTEVRPFDDKQITLLKTFADQAVIAIENVRLFNEIQEKSRQLELANRHKSSFSPTCRTS